MDNPAIRAFNDFFINKGNTAPIAEKANRNYLLKYPQESGNKKDIQRLFYFSIGHVFKQLENKAIFKYETDDEGKTIEKKFTCLTKDFFTKDFAKKIKVIIENIRNINSHYIHDFNKIEVNNIDDNVVKFLKEAFELAVIHIYLREQKETIKFSEFEEDTDKDKKIVKFLCDKFFPFKKPDKNADLTEEQKEGIERKKQFIEDFKNKTKSQAIDYILFITNEENIEWKLYETHKVFDIQEGKYLSFHGSLFLLSMFLYKGEANKLISKIRGFKRNDDNKFKSKRNLFSFYSKKFSSQDIDSEENNLIKFRDIVQYLNHYPTAWNNELELESKVPVMTNVLKEKIINSEVARCYPKYVDNERFLVYAKFQIWGRKHLGKSIEKEYIKQAFSDNEIDDFNYEIYRTKEYKDAIIKKKQIQIGKQPSYKKKRNLEKTERILRKEKNKINKDTEKLKIRIAKNLLYMQYGRNQDRFVEFAVRFLAENNYFGKDAEFKLYKHYSMQEQEEDLKQLKKKLSKKEYDKLKYHQGKLTHFSTFEEHLKKYPSWDTPFVIESNTIKVKIKFYDNSSKIFFINRKSLIYFLEHALNSEKTERAGKDLLTKYFFSYQKEFNSKKEILRQNDSISKEEKTEFKKLFPKRLLHKYSPVESNNNNKISSLELLLENAKQSEKRYKKLLEKVKKEENEYKRNFPNEDVRLVEYFEKRNKGKQFKLKFIRKACHLMFFKKTYLQQVEKEGEHHKRFHINRDEYNDFSKWMFAFEDVPIYKKLLDQLFEDKGFYISSEFKYLFGSSDNLDEMYNSTKELYTEWLKTNNNTQKDENKYKLENYNALFDDDTFFINTSHFIKFLKEKSIIKRNENQHIIYKSLENEKYLISEYYYKNKLEKENYKTCGKLFNKLKKNKLEDALLYQIAMKYLIADKNIAKQIPTSIDKLLTQEIKFTIKDKNKNRLFDLFVPFNKLMAFQELKTQKQKEEEKFSSSFLSKMINYLEKVKGDKDIKQIYESYKKDNSLKYEDLYKINNHVINNSSKFTKVAMGLEKYFIFKDRINISSGENRIFYEDVNRLVTLLAEFDRGQEKIRNKAFHFGVPLESYENTLKQIENKFLITEVKSIKPTSFDELPNDIKSVCNIFLEKIHYDFYKGKHWDVKFSTAKKKYFDEIISKS